MNIKILSTVLLLASPFVAFAEKAAPATPAPEKPAMCPVSGEELGEMGKPYEYTYKVEGKPDQKVLLCCKHCVAKFEKDPAKYLKAAPATPEAPAKTKEHMGMEHAH